MKQNPPQKHHYIPEFYLKRWTHSGDRRLWQFSKPNNKLIMERKFPSQTGFSKRLYSYDGAPEHQAHLVEEYFFKPVDSGAVQALLLIEKFQNKAKWNTKLRSAWSRFLYSLLLRCPEDLELFKKIWRKQMFSDPEHEWEKRYQAAREDGDPATLEEAMLAISEMDVSASGMRTLMSLIDSASLGQKLNNLPWHILSTTNARFEMLTSDRPIIRTNGLQADGGHMALPVGPRLLFIVGKDHDAIRRIITMDVNEVVRQVNEMVVSRAIRFVYSTSAGPRAFIEKKMSTQHDHRIFESFEGKEDELSASALRLS